MSPHKVEVLPSPLALHEYDISDNGFLPAHAPLAVLPDDYYRPWERVVAQLAELIKTRQIREEIDHLPILSTSRLRSGPEWQRAYLVLALLSQGYIWQGPQPTERLPPCISVPFLDVAARLQVLPVATYAALNLWNWRPTRADADIRQPEGQRVLHTFTGTEDENWFFVVSNAMEARAAPLLKRMLFAIESVGREDTISVIECLRDIQRRLIEIGSLLERMDERCDPQVFYHKIRPFLAGSLNMQNSGLANGIFFDEGDGEGSWRKFRGGSNGQSSLIQFFDVVLGIEHAGSANFHTEMRTYMPGPHARFLDDVEAVCNIRSYVTLNEVDKDLAEAYNAAVASLSAFRDKHIQLVTKYIIIPSRMPPPKHDRDQMNLAAVTTALANQDANTRDLIGTGGTKLVPFLRESRNETTASIIPTR